jgi:hypothetical protein
VVCTEPRGNWARAATRLWPALVAPGYLSKGLSLIGALRRSGVPRFPAATGVRIEGSARAEAVVFASGGREHRIAAQTVLLHQGVVPNANLWQSLDIEHHWDAMQHCFRPVVDDWGNTTLAGVLVAGDSAGIGGAEAALCAGELSGLSVAWQQRRIDTGERDRRAWLARRALKAHWGVRPFLDRLYAGTGRRRHDRLPLRGGHGGRTAPAGGDRYPGAEPDEGLQPLRDGAVPGPAVRSHADRADRNDPAALGLRGRLPAHPGAGAASDRRRAG